MLLHKHLTRKDHLDKHAIVGKHEESSQVMYEKVQAPSEEKRSPFPIMDVIGYLQ